MLNLQQPLQDLPSFDGLQVVKRDAMTLEITVSQGEGLTTLFRQLAQSGLQVSTMRNKQNRLEQLFLELTSTDGAEQ